MLSKIHLLLMSTGGFILFIGSLIIANPSSAQKSAENTVARRKINLKLVAEHKKNVLLDISDDGRLLLTHQTSTPVHRYTIPEVGAAQAHQSPPFDDRLRVVERESGREVGSVPVDFFTYNRLFVPGTKQVFYMEPQPSSQPRDWHYKLWLPVTGQNLICSETSDGAPNSLVFLDQQHAVGSIWMEGSGDVLVQLSFPGCVFKRMGPIDPTDPKRRVRGKIAVSPDKKTLAYDSGTHIIIRDNTSNEVIKRLDSGSLFFTGQLSYTPDGKSLIALACASKCLSADEEGTFYLWFYDTTNYKMTRQLEVPRLNTFAISPDSQLLAVSYKLQKRSFLKTVEQGNIDIYELATGRKLTTASHPPVEVRRENLWAADINYLNFTPDGKYLMSSTYDTRIWRVGE